MLKGNSIGMAIVSLALILTSSAFAQGNGKRSAVKMNRTAKTSSNSHSAKNKARYANQETSYLKNSGNEVSIETIHKSSTKSFDKGYIQPAATAQQPLTLLPYIEQSNLKPRKTPTTTSRTGTQHNSPK